MSKAKEMWEAVKFQRCQKCEYAKKVSRYTIYCPFFSCMQAPYRKRMRGGDDGSPADG